MLTVWVIEKLDQGVWLPSSDKMFITSREAEAYLKHAEAGSLTKYRVAPYVRGDVKG